MRCISPHLAGAISIIPSVAIAFSAYVCVPLYCAKFLGKRYANFIIYFSNYLGLFGGIERKYLLKHFVEDDLNLVIFFRRVYLCVLLFCLLLPLLIDVFLLPWFRSLHCP